MADDLDDLDVELQGLEDGPGDAEPIVFVREDVLRQMRAHGGEDLDNELGGILLGSASSSEHGTLVFVEAAIPALHTDAARGSVTFTHDTWAEINRVKDADYPDKRVVGWYHTHPGFGLFLSEYDLFIHRNFFDLPWQVALVIDPRSGKDGFFAWRGEEIEGPREFETVEAGATSAPAEELDGQTPVEAPSLAVNRALLVWQWLVLGAILALVAVMLTGNLKASRPGRSENQIAGQLAAVQRRLGELQHDVQALHEQKVSAPAYTTHTVRPGDSLWRIAEQAYGDGARWGAIALFNGIEPDDVEPGMVLKIPHWRVSEDAHR